MTSDVVALQPKANIVELRPGSSTARDGSSGRSGFIASPWRDGLLFILSPLLGLALVKLCVTFDAHTVRLDIFGQQRSVMLFFITTWTYAHLVAVFCRSHLNRDVFGRHHIRFVVVPVILFLGLMVSQWLFVTGLVVAAFWDIYHTSMQNFGFCRLYDSKRGNDPLRGRGLDIWLNHYLYIGPILAGLSLQASIEPLTMFRDAFGWTAPAIFAEAMVEIRLHLALAIVLSGLLFLAWYLLAYVKLVRDGYRLSWQKVALLLSTGLTSIYAWGFMPPFEAFFATNFFHALQYFGLVWWSEKGNMQRVLRVDQHRSGRVLALIVYLVSIFLLGTGYTLGNHANLRWAISLGLVVSLMHFWYDGFIWSIRRRQVEIVS